VNAFAEKEAPLRVPLVSAQYTFEPVDTKFPGNPTDDDTVVVE
jgi:hypothetical protein